MANRSGPTLIQRSRRVSPAEKAAFHQVAGAGRSRVLREFFDLNVNELGQIKRLMDQRLKQNLSRQG